MTMVVGYTPDDREKAALPLAAMLARSSGDDLVVCCVVPVPWVPGMARVDAEYQAFLDHTADHALERARASLPADIAARFVRHSARSAPAGLLEVAAEHAATLVVLGSSSAGGFGRVVLGSVTHRLLHSSPLPVALATRGFRAKAGAKVVRVTAAYGAAAAGEDLIVASAAFAARVGAALRIASFAVWARPAYTTRLGTDPDDSVLQEWLAAVERNAGDAVTQVGQLLDVPRAIETVIGHGADWAEAIDDVAWGEGDVLVVGSSSVGPMARVFLGSRAAKIVRHSPVPVVVVPRHTAAELADRATHF